MGSLIHSPLSDTTQSQGLKCKRQWLEGGRQASVTEMIIYQLQILNIVHLLYKMNFLV